MTDWTTLPNAAVGVGGLPSGTTVTALRDNPVAIAEGAPGAPRVQARGVSPGLLGKMDGSGTTASGFMDLDPLTVLRLDAYFSGPVIGAEPVLVLPASLQMRVSVDNGEIWSSWSTLGQRRLGVCFGYLDLLSGLFVGSVHELSDTNQNPFNPLPGNISINFSETDINAFQIRLDVSGAVYVATANYVSRAGE